MRLPSLICVAALVSACATTPPQSASSSETSGLPTSKLSPGECGLFGWSTDDSREFIFYADKNTARYAGPDGPVNLSAQTPFPATDYVDSIGQIVTLRLGQSEIMNDGLRYPSARIVTLTEQGWERLKPVAIVETCQPE